MGVALLGGFGDLNVDRSASKGEAAGNTSPAKETSTAITLQPADLLRMRAAELKKKLKEAGVDLSKHPGAVEKKVQLY